MSGGGAMRRLARDTAVYGLSSIVGRLLNWLMVSLYTYTLKSTGEYGVVTNLYGYTALFMALLTYGMETGFFRFINRAEERQPERVYASVLYSVGFTSLLFAVLVLLFLTPVSRALRYEANPEFVGMMGCIVAVDAFCCLPFAYLRYRNRPLRFAGLKLTGIGLNVFLNVFFLVICPLLYRSYPAWVGRFYAPDYGVGYIFLSNAFATGLTFLLLIPEMLPGLRASFDGQRLRRILGYSFPILILSVAGILNQTAHAILFPFLFADKAYADSQLGVYGACSKLALVMILFIQAFRYAYEPFVFSQNRAKDPERVYVEVMRYFIIFSLLIFLGVMFYLDLLKWLIEADYYSGLRAVPVIMAGEMFFGVYYNLSVWYKLTDRTVWGAYFSLTGCVLTVLVIMVFVPRYGFMACAWASLLSNLLMMLLSYFVGRRRFPVAYDLRSAFVYAAAASVCYVAGMLPVIDSVMLRLAYRTVILLLFVGMVVKRDLPLSEVPVLRRFFKK
jgi:O-antigen/teichoic acid export membrane protein